MGSAREQLGCMMDSTRVTNKPVSAGRWHENAYPPIAPFVGADSHS
jgi:hypothetical protein